jgi:hypothetical protein
MPVNVVMTAEREELWERAKEIVQTRYPDARGDRSYRLVMGIYKKMAHYRPARDDASRDYEFPL